MRERPSRLKAVAYKRYSVVTDKSVDGANADRTRPASANAHGQGFMVVMSQNARDRISIFRMCETPLLANPGAMHVAYGFLVPSRRYALVHC